MNRFQSKKNILVQMRMELEQKDNDGVLKKRPTDQGNFQMWISLSVVLNLFLGPSVL